MRFAHIDCQKIRMVLVVRIERLYVANLAAERWSSEAAEHQHQRASGRSLSNVELCAAIEREQPCVRRIIANLQISAMHMRERIPNHAVSIFRAARHDAQSDEDEHYQRRDRNQSPFKNWMQTESS